MVPRKNVIQEKSSKDSSVRVQRIAPSTGSLLDQPLVDGYKGKVAKLEKKASRKRKVGVSTESNDLSNSSPHSNRRLTQDMVENIAISKSPCENKSTTSTDGVDVVDGTVQSFKSASVSPPAIMYAIADAMLRDLERDDEDMQAAVRDQSSSKRGFKWTKEQDEHLKTAVQAEEENVPKKLGKWERVAEHMRQLLPGELLTGEMCRVRWSHYVGPMQKGLKKGASWSKAEVQKLKALVAEHSKQINGNTVINWPLICDAEHMNRIPQECRNKWYDLCDDVKEHGPFTEAENILILQSVANWTCSERKKTGLWVSLGNDLDRPSKRIRDHWRCNLVPKDKDDLTN